MTFTVPQGEFQRLSQASEGFRKTLVTEAYSQESGQLLDTGELVVVDNRVDPATATVQLKARFTNPERRLWPGQLLNVKLTLQTVHNVLALPSARSTRDPRDPTPTWSRTTWRCCVRWRSTCGRMRSRS